MLAWMILLQTALTLSVAGPLTSPEYLPIRVAEAEGYFAGEQVTVAVRDARSPAEAARELGQGVVQLAATSLDAAVRFGQADGRPPLLVAGLTAAPPVVVVVPAAMKGTVTDISDLAGRLVGIPGPGRAEHGVLVSLLHAARIPVGKVRIESLGAQGLAAAVGQGTVAAAVIGDPWATRLLAAGAVALVDLRQPDAARRWLGGPTVHAAVFVPGRSAFQAGQLQPFVRAVARAIRRIEDTSPDELAIGLPTSVVGLPDDFAERVAGARALYLSDGLVDAERLARSLALVRDRWPIPVALKLPKNAADLLLGDRR